MNSDLVSSDRDKLSSIRELEALPWRGLEWQPEPGQGSSAASAGAGASSPLQARALRTGPFAVEQRSAWLAPAKYRRGPGGARLYFAGVEGKREGVAAWGKMERLAGTCRSEAARVLACQNSARGGTSRGTIAVLPVSFASMLTVPQDAPGGWSRLRRLPPLSVQSIAVDRIT